jgi:predicted HTH domain antitoxin
MTKTQNITIELPSDILLTLNENEAELKQDIKTALALRLYQQAKITIGKAAQISGLSRLEFDLILSRNGISCTNLATEDVFRDIEKLS